MTQRAWLFAQAVAHGSAGLAMTTIPATRRVRIAGKRAEAVDICSFELVDPDGRTLPPFLAGSHIDVNLPNGLVRQYSLCNDPRENHRYS